MEVDAAGTAEADIYTIGHSTRPLEELIEALREHGVELLADVRTAPRSRHVPQCNTENLAQALPAAGIDYLHVKELGGWRTPLGVSANTGWRSKGFQGYADYLQTANGQAALERLLQMSRRRKTAFMCAEALPHRCHRSIISDALVARGLIVCHILAPGKSRLHRLTPFAVVEGTRVTYPARS